MLYRHRLKSVKITFPAHIYLKHTHTHTELTCDSSSYQSKQATLEVLKTYITGEFWDLADILELWSITVVHAVAFVVSKILLVLHLSDKNAQWEAMVKPSSAVSSSFTHFLLGRPTVQRIWYVVFISWHMMKINMKRIFIYPLLILQAKETQFHPLQSTWDSDRRKIINRNNDIHRNSRVSVEQMNMHKCAIDQVPAGPQEELLHS